MKTNIKYLLGGLIALIVLISLLVYLQKQSEGPGELDQFATCLKEKGAKFYGAFWCPHCNNQKKMFGKSAKLLPYVECSTPDASGQTEDCNKLGIESYPTWIFADGSKLNGEIPLQQLAEKTSCQLPVKN